MVYIPPVGLRNPQIVDIDDITELRREYDQARQARRMIADALGQAHQEHSPMRRCD